MIVVLWLAWELLVHLVVLVLFLVLVVVFVYFWHYSKIRCIACCCRPRFCGVSTIDRRFSSYQLCSANFSSMYNSVVCSNMVFVREVALAQLHCGSPTCLPASVRVFQILFQLQKDVREQFLQLPPAFPVRSTYGTIERSICAVFALALPPTLRALVPAIVSDRFQILCCSDVIVLENFG